MPSGFSLSITPGALSPAFDPATFVYAARVGMFVDHVTLTATAPSRIQVGFNDELVASGQAWQSPLLAIGPNVITVHADEAGFARRSYTLTVTRGYQEAYLKANATRVVAEGAGTGDELGARVALSGDTLVVSAVGDPSAADGVNGDQTDDSAAGAGAAYVFVRNGETWTQQAYLKASNSDEDDRFGTSVAIDGNTIVVGAPREGSSATGVNGSQLNEGTYAGAAYVFVRNGSTWTQQAYLKAGYSGLVDLFGTSVAIAGDTVVIGSPQESSSSTTINGPDNDDALSAGAAFVFLRSGTTWSQQAHLKAANAEAQDRFGEQVAIDGATILVGAPGESSQPNGTGSNPSNNSAASSGAAYVFTRAGGTWTQQAYIKANAGQPNDRFGSAVAISDNVAVVGAFNEGSNATGVDGTPTSFSAIAAGAAYIFERAGTSWSQTAYLKASNTNAYDGFGEQVAVDNGRVIVGAPWEASNATGFDGRQSNNSAVNSGAVYVFVRGAAQWQQLAYVKASNARPDHYFGSVAISGDSVIVGAPGETSASSGINGSQTDNGAYRAGAIYVLR